MTLPWALHGNIGYQIRCRRLLALCAEMMVNDNGEMITVAERGLGMVLKAGLDTDILN